MEKPTRGHAHQFNANSAHLTDLSLSGPFSNESGKSDTLIGPGTYTKRVSKPLPHFFIENISSQSF